MVHVGAVRAHAAGGDGGALCAALFAASASVEASEGARVRRGGDGVSSWRPQEWGRQWPGGAAAWCTRGKGRAHGQQTRACEII